MDLMTLKATLTLNTKEFDEGLDKSKSKMSGFGSTMSSFGSSIAHGFGTIAKVGVAAVGAATAAVTGFGVSAVKTRMEFDSAMSQVSATLGFTTADIKENVNGAGDAFKALSEKAEEAGRTTVFSATECAEGLNILAMSGYNANDSIAMLDDVLHLAAAGSMDMATAAGYVSGTMKGFADDTKTSGYYADLMAKGATLANTSVQELGDAMSSGAAGAASYGQSAESMTVSLLILAEQGEVGSAAGTALAAAMKNVYAGTNQAKKALKDLGVEAFDPATGKARDFNDVVNDLDAALAGYSDEQQQAYKTTIFGIQGLNAFNKMTVTGTEKQEEWADALSHASDGMGEAAKQYGTMTDNLQGDLSAWNSAMEGFKNAIASGPMEGLREFVQFGTDGLSRITEAFKSGGITEAVSVFGDVLGEGLNMIIAKLPEFINVGTEVLGAIGQGLMNNMPTIMNAAVQVTTMLINALSEGAPQFIEGGMQILEAIAQAIIDNLDTLIPAALQVIEKITMGILENLPMLIEGGLQIIVGLAQGIAEMLPELIPTIVEVVITIVTTLIENVDLLIDAAIQLMIGLANGLIQALPTLIQAIPTLVEAIVTAIIENLPLLVEAAVQIHLALCTALVENAPLLLDAIVQIWTMIGQLIIEYGSQFLTNIGEMLSNLIQTVSQWLAQLPSLAANFAGQMLGSFINAILSLPEKAMEIFNNVITNVQNFGQKLIAEGPKMANEFKQKLIDIMKTIPPKMLEIGGEIVEGLKNGIANAWESFKGWMGDMVSGFIEGVKEGLKIGSPSKVMADEVGKWIPAGIAVGIEENMGVLDNAMDAMYNAVTPDYVSATNAGTASIDLATVINLLQSINENTAEPIKLEGDMDRIFRVMQSKATANYRLTGNKTMVTI